MFFVDPCDATLFLNGFITGAVTAFAILYWSIER